MVTLGVDRLLDDRRDLLDGRRLGLVTNPSGVTADLTPTVDALADHPDADLRRLFAPEHGIRGDREAGVEIDDAVDERTGRPVTSLYGDTRRLDPSMVADLDAVLFDLQTVGCRFYTYLYTLAYAPEGIAGTDAELVVLDRPNPIAPVAPDGNRMPDEHASFVGGYRLPIVHGLTVGEVARYVNDAFDVGAALTVVELEGWDRGWYDDAGLAWVPPSPNLPTLDAATLYPGTCLFEGTTLSEGRGTTKPFELIGAPRIDGTGWAAALNALDLPGVRFRPATFRPSFSKHEGEQVGGVQIHLRDRDRVAPVQVGLAMLVSAFVRVPETRWREADGYPIDRLAGGPWLRERIDALDGDADPAAVVADIRESWRADLEAFAALRERYRLYNA